LVETVDGTLVLPRWWFLEYLLDFAPKIGEIDWSIFFNWVGSTTT